MTNPTAFFNAHIGPNPAHVSYGGVHPLDMELVFETERKAVEWSDYLAALNTVGVELFRTLQGLVEKISHAGSC